MGASSEIMKTVASKFVFIVRCRTGEAIDSVSAICPMLYWGSFYRCATASSATSGGV